MHAMGLCYCSYSLQLEFCASDGAVESECGEFGVDVQYKYGGKLVGERTRRPLTGKITELLFADDTVATGTDRDGTERAAKELERLVKCWGLTQSLAKTKLVVVGGEGSEDELRPLILEGGEIESVEEGRSSQWRSSSIWGQW